MPIEVGAIVFIPLPHYDTPRRDDIAIPDAPGTWLRASSGVRCAKPTGVEATYAIAIGCVDPVTRAAALDFLATGPRA